MTDIHEISVGKRNTGADNVEMCIRDSCITAYIDAHHELSPLRFLREPHDSFRMNDKVVCIIPVSYTHLDVYKRQSQERRFDSCQAHQISSNPAFKSGVICFVLVGFKMI